MTPLGGPAPTWERASPKAVRIVAYIHPFAFAVLALTGAAFLLRGRFRATSDRLQKLRNCRHFTQPQKTTRNHLQTGQEVALFGQFLDVCLKPWIGAELHKLARHLRGEATGHRFEEVSDQGMSFPGCELSTNHLQAAPARRPPSFTRVLAATSANQYIAGSSLF